MMLVDSNVVMYAGGAPHPNKAPSVRFLESVADGSHEAAIDAEVLQEILHRCVAIDRRDAVQPCFDVVLEIVDEVLEVDLEVMQRAREIVLGRAELTARDAIHLAVMQRSGIREIASFDRHFDGVPGVARLH